MWIASTHYRKPLDYNEKDIEVAKAKVEKIVSILKRITQSKNKAKESKSSLVNEIQTLKKQFYDAMMNDVNAPLALTYLFQLISVTNKHIDEGRFSKADLQKAEDSILELGEFFQIVPKIQEEEAPDQVMRLVEEREKARKNRDWAAADALRLRIRELGYLVEDSTEGSQVRKASD
jgi:cysteinyl-tRNA synthetase